MTPNEAALITRGLFQRPQPEEPMMSPVPQVSYPPEQVSTPSADVIEQEGVLDNVRAMLNNWDSAMKIRKGIANKGSVPLGVETSQEQNLRQAEEELAIAKEEDAQTGADGYENKEGGIFSRMANWGSSVGEYLFGKDTRSEADKLADQAIQDAEKAAIEREKEQKGVIGYYYDKLFGETSPEEEAKIAEDKKRMGVVGYYGKLANDTLNTMARSPFSKWADPTTMLGGQQTMVKNLDRYFEGRSLAGLRKELLAQDNAKAGTTVGQAKEYAGIMTDPNVSDEEKAAMISYLNRANKGTASSYPKTVEQAFLREVYDAETALGRDLTPDEMDVVAQRYGSADRNALLNPSRASAVGEPNTPKELIISRAQDNIRKGMSPLDAVREAEQAFGAPEGYLFSGNTYQGVTPENKYNVKAAEEEAKNFVKNIASKVDENATTAYVNKGKAEQALSIVEKHPEYVGKGQMGVFVEELKNQFGVNEDDAAILYTLAADVGGQQMSTVIDEQNVGSISEPEREYFRKQTVNLGDSPAAVKARLKLFILQNELALESARFMNKLRADGVPYDQRHVMYMNYLENRGAETERRIAEIVSPVEKGYMYVTNQETGEVRKVRRK